jgi:L-lactate dehydrogenase complex protein LldG
MTASACSRFESRLAQLDIPVTRTDGQSFRSHIEDVVEPRAVGVPLDETFEDEAFSLADTSVKVDPTPATLETARTGVTAGTVGVADYGSLVLSVTDRASELVSLFVDRHVAVVRESDVVDGMDTAVETIAAEFRETGGSAIVATGPSATADMGELVKGAHGPREVHVVILDGGE